jgi:hypothetical protein
MLTIDLKKTADEIQMDKQGREPALCAYRPCGVWTAAPSVCTFRTVAKEGLPVRQVPVHTHSLLQKAKRPVVRVLQVRARKLQPGHQRHRLRARDAAVEEQRVQGRAQPMQLVVVLLVGWDSAAGGDRLEVPLLEVCPSLSPLQPVAGLVLLNPGGQDLLQLLLLLALMRPLLLDLLNQLMRSLVSRGDICC